MVLRVLPAADSKHLEAAVDVCVPCHLATDHPRRGDVCGQHAVCNQALCGDPQVELTLLIVNKT